MQSSQNKARLGRTNDELYTASISRPQGKTRLAARSPKHWVAFNP